MSTDVPGWWDTPGRGGEGENEMRGWDVEDEDDLSEMSAYMHVHGKYYGNF